MGIELKKTNGKQISFLPGTKKPVFFIDGKLVSYSEGVKELRKLAGQNTTEFAREVFSSGRTVEGWEQGKEPGLRSLVLMQFLLRTLED